QGPRTLGPRRGQAAASRAASSSLLLSEGVRLVGGLQVLEVTIPEPGHLDLELVAPPEERRVALVVGDRPPGVAYVRVDLGLQRVPVGRSLPPDQDPVDLSHRSPPAPRRSAGTPARPLGS